VVWLPPLVLHPLSWAALGLQKLLKPRAPALNVARVFASKRYDLSTIRAVAAKWRANRWSLQRLRRGKRWRRAPSR